MSTFQQTFHVTGMTCDHCVAAVEEEVGAIAGVTQSPSTWPAAASPSAAAGRSPPPRWPPRSMRPATSSPPDQHAPRQHPTDRGTEMTATTTPATQPDPGR